MNMAMEARLRKVASAITVSTLPKVPVMTPFEGWIAVR